MVWNKSPDLEKQVKLDNQNYSFTNNLKKDVDLPDFHSNDLGFIRPVRRDFVLVICTIKGLFFNTSSKCKERFVVFTKNGLLLIYKSNNQGILVNVKHAKSLKFDRFTISFEGERTTFHGITLSYDFGKLSLLLNHTQRSSFCQDLMALYHEPPHHENDQITRKDNDSDATQHLIKCNQNINCENNDEKYEILNKSSILTMKSFVDGCKMTSTPINNNNN
uniref:TLDc domain-containing protein n=1 Tax=Strongyloides venezuelensis TaxID=75913 RepID=A0A0K0FXV7_STRVS